MMISTQALLVFVVVAAGLVWLRRTKKLSQAKVLPADLESKRVGRTPPPSEKPIVIEPLADFDWQGAAPQEFRPFKPIFYITMALQSTAPSELVIIDSNYLDRVTERRGLIAEHGSTVVGSIPSGLAAVQELYAYLLGTYLPTRYPTLFSLGSDGQFFHNTVTGLQVPVTPPEDAAAALRVLGETIEDDIFLLLETPKGHLSVAFCCCFPTGFDPSAKLGRLLAEIHAPVPSYEKIGASMERFFSRLEVGKSVKRVNWSITPQAELFNSFGNHIHEGEEYTEDEVVDIDQARLRVELQTLTRLPKTRAICFSFKTYLYPLRQVKEEGLALQLADAIEGLKHGNAPGMWMYKGGVRWGKSVTDFLRS